MANPAFGFNSYMQFARDAGWSAFPTITKRFPIYSANAKALAGRIRPAILDGTLLQPALVAGMQMCQLEISMPVCYTGQLILWDLIMGTDTYATSGGSSTPGPSPYTHTWTAFKTLLNSGSFEIIQGGVPTTSCIRCTGMKVQKMTLKCSAGIDIMDQIARMDLVLIGYALTQSASITASLTSPTLDFVLASHIDVMDDVGQSVIGGATTEMELVIDTMAKERPFLEGAGYVSEPQRERRPQWTLSYTREFQANTALTAFLANTAATTNFGFSTGGGAKALLFSGTGAMATYPENPIEGDEWIKQKIVIEGQTDSLSAIVVNAQATITT